MQKKAALDKLSRWIAQVDDRLKGINLTRNQLVNWLIQSHASELSAQELKQIEQEFFDEVKFAQWALAALRVAKGKGETVTLADIVAQGRSTKSEKSQNQTQPKKSHVLKAPTQVHENTRIPLENVRGD